MAVMQKPVFMVSIECPVCKNLNEFENLKMGAYNESGRDSDFCPTGRIWSDPAYQKFNPLLFYFTTCYKCYFSHELNASYKDWNSDTNFKTYKLPIIRKKHLEELSAENSFIKLLGDNINSSARPFESAVIKILLAIYDEILGEKGSNLDLARYFLRLAWLFREQGGENVQSPLELSIARIRNELDRIQLLANEAQSKLGQMKTIAEQVPMADAIGSGGDGGFPTFNPAISKVERSAGDFIHELDNLRNTVNHLKSEFVVAENKDKIQAPFGSYQSFTEYLITAKKIWSDVPLNETEALRKSIEYYIKAYQKRREINKGLPQLQAAYLIGELSRRIGDNNLAQEYFRITIKEAHSMVIEYKSDQAMTANIRKILEMATEQARTLRLASGGQA